VKEACLAAAHTAPVPVQ
jgi:hypothetical protein